MIYVFLTIAYIVTLFYLAKKAGDGSKRDPEKQLIITGERLAAVGSAE